MTDRPVPPVAAANPEKPGLRRVLIASRGATARRLIQFYHDLGVETAACFSEPDADLSYLDDADYPVYLGGRSVEETYLSPARVIEAAMDAGCEAIHPGTCFLAEHLGFYQAANTASLAVIGADPKALAQADRIHLRRLARDRGIPVLPGSEALVPGDDGIAAAASVGFPLFVKSIRGRVLRRVERMDDLAGALAAVRAESPRQTGERAVYLERAVDGLRQIGVPVVGDRNGNIVALGVAEATLEHGASTSWRTGIEEFGAGITGIDPGVEAASVDLAKALGWVAVGRVRWAVTGSGGWFLQGFSGRLTSGFDLVEAVHGVDLVETQLRCLMGRHLGWDGEDAAPEKHGIQLRIVHMDLDTGIPTAGTLERLELPEGAITGVDEGMALDADTEPIIAKITVVAETRAAAIARARVAIAGVIVEGVPTNVHAIDARLAELEGAASA